MRALVFCNDPWHPASMIQRGLEPFSKNGIQFTFAADDAVPPKDLSGFSFVVLARANLQASNQSKAWLSPASENILPDYVRSGGGLLVVHAGISRYEKLPQMNALIGGAFVRHPDPCAVTVEPKPGHSMTAKVSAFTVEDEHYFVSMNDAETEVFLHALSINGVQPAGWRRTEGRGRVCVLTPGHNLQVLLHPEFQKLLSNAVGFVRRIF